MSVTTISNNAIVTDKNTLLVTPIKPKRYLVVEETRELYYDNENNERFKIRDIQLLLRDEDRLSAKSFNQDLYYVIDTNTLWFYKIVSDEEGNNIGSWSIAHPLSGVEANTYTMVSVDEYGHVVSGLNPTTLEEYHLTDDTIRQINDMIDEDFDINSTNAIMNSTVTKAINQLNEDIKNSIKLQIDDDGTLYFPTTFGSIEGETMYL